MTKPQPPPSPIDVCFAIDAIKSNHFSRVGEGRWTGAVYDRDGQTYDVVELASGWQVTDEQNRVYSGRTLAYALKKAGLS